MFVTFVTCVPYDLLSFYTSIQSEGGNENCGARVKHDKNVKVNLIMLHIKAGIFTGWSTFSWFYLCL